MNLKEDIQEQYVCRVDMSLTYKQLSLCYHVVSLLCLSALLPLLIATPIMMFRAQPNVTPLIYRFKGYFPKYSDVNNV